MDKKNRIFLSFAAEDASYRTKLVEQARSAQSPIEFVEMAVKEPWDEAWKTECRTKIKECDGVIALLSKQTMQSSGARCEMNCANVEQVPIIGVVSDKTEKPEVPPELHGRKIIEWTWGGISSFINGLPQRVRS